MSDINLSMPDSSSNGDEDKYQNRIASYSKCMPHNEFGEPDVAVYNTFIGALNTGDYEAADAIAVPGPIKLRNAFAGRAKIITGSENDPKQSPAAPTFASDVRAAEMIELYWASLMRDVKFAEYADSELVAAACAELNSVSGYNGNRGEDGSITPNNVLRGPTQGDVIGPYISQFLLQDIPYGPITVEQKMNTYTLGENRDYMVTHEDWLNVQNSTGKPQTPYNTKRYPVNGRDLGILVANDFATYPITNALLMLSNKHSYHCPLDHTNPYNASDSQFGFVTLGYAEIYHAAGIILDSAYRKTYYDRWMVHKTIRPEEFAGRVHHQILNDRGYDMHEQVLTSEAVKRLHAQQNTYMLSQVNAVGCPFHPSYPGGHGLSAGSSLTLLKAFVKEDFVIPNPVVPSADGSSLVPYEGPELTVGHELDKLASNIAVGKQFAGAHWLSDTVVGMNQGEAVAIEILGIMKATYAEPFAGFELTRFNGEKATV